MGVACKRRTSRRVTDKEMFNFNARRVQRETNRRKAFLSDLLRRLESIRDENEDIATLHKTLSSRKDALCAVRERLGVPSLDGEPCEHCGAHLFAQEPRRVCCKHGKFVLPRFRTFRHHCNDCAHRQIRNTEVSQRKSCIQLPCKLRVHEYAR